MFSKLSFFLLIRLKESVLNFNVFVIRNKRVKIFFTKVALCENDCYLLNRDERGKVLDLVYLHQVVDEL